MNNELAKILKNELKEISKQYGLSIESEITEIDSLKRTKKLEIPYFYNIAHFCKVTDFSQKQITFFINQIDKAYTTFKIPKRNVGKREIDAPSKKLKFVQRWILDNILYQLDPGEYAYGFIPDKSIKDNASIHVNQELICGIDIKDYFPSITANRVWGFFKSIGYNNNMANNFTKLTTYKGRIPQGAPTSPMIANLISWRMDKRLAKFCEIRGFKYSRYADDITISGKNNLPRYIKSISKIIESERFEINSDKFRIIGRGSAQKVTGIIVNDSASIGRNKKRRLRAIAHNISKNGPVIENRNNDPFFKERLFGEMGYAKMINPEFANPLIQKLKQIEWKNYNEYTAEYIEEEKIKRDLTKSIKYIIKDFTDLGFFKDIPELSKSTSEESNELIKELKILREKCKEHSKENCQKCLFEPINTEYQKCLKYIIGKYIQKTGGHHHGHEVYDIGGDAELYNKMVFVIFLLKSSNLSPKEKNRLFIQVFDCYGIKEIDVISIVSPDNLDHKLELRIRRVARENSTEKDLCLILKKDTMRIYKDFKDNILTN